MSTESLTDILKKLTEISAEVSNGSVETLSSTTREFARAITQEARIPPQPTDDLKGGVARNELDGVA
ncbi:MAG: hypothetical protein JO047_05840 [Alphaproteobacteria bacterium]|nr:hypothetical protein [Alphaproteobacteria bacterium]